VTALNILPEDLRSLLPEVLLAIRDLANPTSSIWPTPVLNYDFEADVHQELFDALIGLKMWRMLKSIYGNLLSVRREPTHSKFATRAASSPTDPGGNNASECSHGAI
jgi:hypothetical protein